MDAVGGEAAVDQDLVGQRCGVDNLREALRRVCLVGGFGRTGGAAAVALTPLVPDIAAGDLVLLVRLVGQSAGD